jgi:hypothetical protein
MVNDWSSWCRLAVVVLKWLSRKLVVVSVVALLTALVVLITNEWLIQKIGLVCCGAVGKALDGRITEYFERET